MTKSKGNMELFDINFLFAFVFETNMPPVESTAAVMLSFTRETLFFPSETNTPPSALLMGGKGVGSSAHSDPTIVPQET